MLVLPECNSIKTKTQGMTGDHRRAVVNKSPKDRVVGPLPNGLVMAYKLGVYYKPGV